MYKFIKSLFWQIVNSIVKICLEIFIFNKRIRRIMKGDFCKFYLGKYCKHSVILNDCEKTYSEKDLEPISNSGQYRIWQYWEQGLEKAPDIVKACLDSVQKYNPEIERIIITPKNIREYVHIPEFIYKLKRRGIIKLAHFSDILRTCLLIEHGGCWIDATVLMTAPLPEYIKNAELFVFKADEKADLDGLNMASYFISAQPNNKILCQTKELMMRYWKENNFLVNYFMFLHAFTMITKYNKEIWDNVPFFSFIPVQQMQAELIKPFNKERFEQLKKTTPIHKLTYKPKVMTKQKNVNIEGSLYEAIIKGKIYD